MMQFGWGRNTRVGRGPNDIEEGWFVYFRVLPKLLPFMNEANNYLSLRNILYYHPKAKLAILQFKAMAIDEGTLLLQRFDCSSKYSLT